MKEDKRATGTGKRVLISRTRKRAVGIFISCIGFIIVVSHLISELLEAGSLTDLLQHWTQPSMIFHLSIEFLTIPTFILIGYFYQKQQNLAENLEQIVEERTERLRKSEKKLKEYTERLEEKVRERTRELLESEERYSSIVNDAIDSLESGIFILDKNFKVVWINKAVEKFFGVNKNDLIGEDKRKAIKEKIKYVFEDPERFEKTVLATYDNNTYVENFECHVLPTKDREERFLVHWSTPIKTGAYAGGRIEHYYDVTKLKQMEQKLLKSERLVAIGETASMVGHDLRNPLQAIINALYLAKKKLESLPPPLMKLAKKGGLLELRDIVKEQVMYMNKIVSDLQDYKRIVEPKLVSTSLRQLINEILSMITVPENVEVSIVIEEDFPKVMVDPTLMKRVFTNLITNALQAMPEGGQLTITAFKKDKTALISIQDTGVGIPEENLPKIFYPLFTTKAKGQGFGLPVCKRLVEAHNGTIMVESKVGKGSTFTVKIPLGREMS